MTDYLTAWIKQKKRNDKTIQENKQTMRWGVLMILISLIFAFVAVADSIWGRWQIMDVIPIIASLGFIFVGILLTASSRSNDNDNVVSNGCTIIDPRKIKKNTYQGLMEYQSIEYIALNSLIKRAKDLKITNIDSHDGKSNDPFMTIDGESNKLNEKYHVNLHLIDRTKEAVDAKPIKIKINGAVKTTKGDEN